MSARTRETRHNGGRDGQTQAFDCTHGAIRPLLLYGNASDPLRFILFQWPAETTHSASANTGPAALPLLDNGPSEASRTCRIICCPRLGASRSRPVPRVPSGRVAQASRLSVTNRGVYPDAPSPGAELPCKATCPPGTSLHQGPMDIPPCFQAPLPEYGTAGPPARAPTQAA